jgi:DNA repair photolyase
LAPFLNEPELEAIVESAAQAGARHGFFMLLRLPWELRDVFRDWLTTHFPDRAARVLARLTEMRSADGQSRLNDPRFHHRMKGEGVWADLLGLRFDRIRRKCGLDAHPVSLRTDLFRAPSRDGQMGLF